MEHISPQADAVPAVSDDRPLLQRVQSDGPEAFAAIMRRYNQRLYRLALALVGDPGEAEDVLQESYVKAYQGLSGFVGRSSLGAWLARIVRNTAIDQLACPARAPVSGHAGGGSRERHGRAICLPRAGGVRRVSVRSRSQNGGG